MDPLVTTAWLVEHLVDDDVRILDCSVGFERTASGELAICSELFVGRDDVLSAIADSGASIVNALTEDQHRGDPNPHGWRGHIPTARNVPDVGLVDPSTSRYFPVDELRTKFAVVLDAQPERIITYGGGGIAASSDAFTLHRLGQSNVAVYDASLEEWASDPQLPLVTGA